jgi:hypothetical protein
MPARVLWQLQTLSIKGESEVLSLSKLMSMMNYANPTKLSTRFVVTLSHLRFSRQPSMTLLHSLHMGSFTGFHPAFRQSRFCARLPFGRNPRSGDTMVLLG